MVYFLIGTSLLANDANKTWQVIQETFKGGMGGPSCEGFNFDSEIKKFKLGSLDSLFHSSELMQKLENSVEGFLKKIERQYLDISGEPRANFTVETQENKGASIEQFLKKFKWEDKIYPRQKPLPEVINGIQQKLNRLDTDFRQKAQTFQEKKNIQNSLQQKEGNLYVRDLVDVLRPEIVKDKDFIYSDNVTTVVAVVPKQLQQKFLQQYLITDNVLPGSAKQFNFDDKDGLLLYRIFLYKKELDPQAQQKMEADGKKNKYKAPIENYISKMREEVGVTIREFHYNKTAFEQRENARSKISDETKSSTEYLLSVCKSHYSAIYNAYIHLKYLRLIVDIASRFGKEEHVAALLQPAHGKEKKVISDLTKIFCEPNQIGVLYGPSEELQDSEDFYPFVYIPINLF